MPQVLARIGGYEVGDGRRLLLIAGPCVMEGEAHALAHAVKVKALAEKHGLPVIFKASFDKANRSSGKSFRGPGLELGMAAFEAVKRETGLPCTTDVHEAWQAEPVGRVVDLLQVPAFLCRQTDLVIACATHGKSVSVKKGQFLAPREMRHAVAKCREAGNLNVLLMERGSSFGYGNLVVDMRGFAVLRRLPTMVIFDTTHALQHPGTGGDRRFARTLARAAIAAGADGLFLETHPDPSRALSDAATQLPLRGIGAFLEEMVEWKRLQARWIEQPDTVAAGAWSDPRAVPGTRAKDAPRFPDGDVPRRQETATPEDRSAAREAPSRGAMPNPEDTTRPRETPRAADRQ
jgi:2-dehydro-3-deoxyphosphooctonate aldolase (KDO 8-P synthase)